MSQPETLIRINGDDLSTANFTPPADRNFRAAWVRDGGTIQINMAAARTIWRDKLRAERAPRLATLDVDFMRAQEQGDSVAAIVAQKQALRDVTQHPSIDAAETPEALKALTLDVLLGE